MPRLHKYLARDAYYVLTAIRGAVITYQLTPWSSPNLMDSEESKSRLKLEEQNEEKNI